MTDIGFYHLQRNTAEVALPKLLSLTLKAGKRAIVRSDSIDFLVALSRALWANNNELWLPHGLEKEGNAEYQPIWLTTQNDNPNKATFLFLIDASEALDISNFERCFDLFDGNDQECVNAGRMRWKLLTEAGHVMHYWQQNEMGKWVDKSN